MSFLLDTDVSSAFLKGDRRVFSKVVQHGGQLAVSTVTVAALMTWTWRRTAPSRRLTAVRDFLRDVTVLDVTQGVAEKFGELRARILDAVQSSPDLDLMIAATPIYHNRVLVTHNLADYQHVPGLKLTDWLDS